MHAESESTCGVPRITDGLRERGRTVNYNTVAKTMAEIGIVGISPRTFEDPDDGGRSGRVLPAGLACTTRQRATDLTAAVGLSGPSPTP
ncbi:IS3 family transposase [Nocardia sp. NPDC055053]